MGATLTSEPTRVIDDLRPYPEYRHVGLPWLDNMPVNWKLRRGKGLFKCIDIRSENGDEELLTVSAAHGVIPRRNATVTMFKAESYAGYKLCWPDDLVINSLWAWGRGLGVSKHHGIISSAYGVYRIRDRESLEPAYVDALVRSDAYNWELHVRSKGIWISRLQLTDESFLDAPFLIPPPAEQAAIVRFLGAVDRRVNRLVRAKRRLIELLTEQKQAIITHAVTRGLNPNAKRKPSGIDWLGDVPEHWEVAALRHRYDQCLGKMLDAKRITGANLVPYLRNTDVQWDRINVEDLPHMDIEPGELNRFTVQPGDLLVCEGGDVGRCAFWMGELEVCGFQKALHRLRAIHRERDYPRFLFYQLFLASKLGVFAARGNESTIAHLTGDKLRAYRFVFAPRVEQLAVANYLDARLSEFEEAIHKVIREIDLIREYRARLVADVVTGKLDVRDAASRLPDDGGEVAGPLDAIAADDIEETIDADELAEEVTAGSDE